MGGTSSEREISLTSGRAAAQALSALGHRVTPVDVGPGVALALAQLRPDAAFIALHGRGGEDGAIQGLLEVMGIPYTGSGVLASAACCDKIVTKQLLAASHIPTPAFAQVTAANRAAARQVPLPVVVKPNRGGSSIGLVVVRDPAELDAAIDLALAEDSRVLAERLVQGREITVGVIAGEALPVVEIVPAAGLFTYQAKYDKTAGTRYITPAELPAPVTERAQTVAVQAYQALGCAGAARVDIMLDAMLAPSVLEINTIPGMTPTSLLPKAAAAVGMDFNHLIGRMLELAVEPGL
ncbi:MAG: D-alanine--D-alanine ligase [Nitrospirae bacterium]|nr:D-alanine--D-alanine ligase [Nitrospirota bacterium]